MQIDKWRAQVQLTVVDGTEPVAMSLDVSGGKVKLDDVAKVVGAAMQKRLEQLGGSTAKERAELAILRDKVRVLEEANAAAKRAADEATVRRVPVVADDADKPKRGRPRKADQ